MKTFVISLLGKLLGLLTPDMFRGALDAALNYIESKVVNSENKIDDKLVLPLCRVLRNAIDLPDTDGVG